MKVYYFTIHGEKTNPKSLVPFGKQKFCSRAYKNQGMAKMQVARKRVLLSDIVTIYCADGFLAYPVLRKVVVGEWYTP